MERLLFVVEGCLVLRGTINEGAEGRGAVCLRMHL